MELNDLLRKTQIDPERVLVLRHRPQEPALNRVLPWLAADRPDLFNAYQQTQKEPLEKAMAALIGKGYVASFIRHAAGRALFVGVYRITGSRPITRKQYWAIAAFREMKAYGLGWAEEERRKSILWIDLTLTDVYARWKGRLVVGWPPPERGWWRRAHRNSFPVVAILEDSALEAAMPEWNRIDLGWEELHLLPAQWKSAISQWRAIYYIFDTSDNKGYVGSAYGRTNLLGRWLGYAADGHGGNRLLRARDPRNLRFSILQRVSPDLDPAEVIQIETTWKERLHTRAPNGLNEN